MHRTTSSAAPRPPRRAPERRGALTVEFAFVAPVAFMIIFAGIEFSRANTIRNTAENAAYEGAREGALPGATAAKAEATARAVLDVIGVNGATISVSPGTITDSTPEVTVQISVPMNQNGWVTPLFFKDRTMVRSVKLKRERTKGQI